MKTGKLTALVAVLIMALLALPGCASKYGAQRTKVNYYPQCYQPVQQLRDDENYVAKSTATGAVGGALLGGEGAKDFREFGDGDVTSLAAPAPRRVLAIDALERATGEEDRARAGLAADGRFLAEVRPPAEKAQTVAGLAEADLAAGTVDRAAARAELAGAGHGVPGLLRR